VLSGKTLHVQARNIVNATGPWADGLPHSEVKLRVTKGNHIVVERSRVAVRETVVMTEGKRILFAIPWGARTILGTTDTDYHGSADHVTAAVADIRYVLQITNQFFPKAKLTAADVISSWAGLRPLLADPSGKPSDISRSHEIKNPEPGWWDVAGGKLTTYRLMAEGAVDQIVKSLKKSNELPPNISPCRTADELLLPAGETQNISGILPPEFCRRVVEHYCANEWAVHLDDVMVRRTSWHHYHRAAALKAEHVAHWMGELLGWTNEQRAAELQRYRTVADCQPAEKASSSAAPTHQNDQPRLPVVEARARRAPAFARRGGTALPAIPLARL
jgi:glycerol-3-phosphate dehydrogenase